MNQSRIWAMPNSLTFTIKPIKELIEKYLFPGAVVVDPWANNSKYGTITNDLNPEFNTTYNLDALEFLKKLEDNSADIVLYDPPYSISQATEMYKSYGKDKLDVHVSNMGYWGECKNQVKRILKTGGICIICGWSSNGIGINRNFEMVEILLVPHGGSKNDTIVTVEIKKEPTQKPYYENPKHT
jgi:DNA modification methylase